MADELGSTFGLWGPGLTFLGGLFGAAIGGPGLEWIKDQIGESRRWKIQKAEIVANVRMALGIIDAFEQIKTAALGSKPTSVGGSYPPAYHDLSPSAFAAMRAFDPNTILELTHKLVALHPRDSIKSAAGQRLVQYIYVLVSQINQVKTVTPNAIENSLKYKFCIAKDKIDILEEFDKEIINFKRFISTIYAKKLGIEALTTIYDPEIKKIERALLELDLTQSQEKYSAALAEYSWNINKASETPPAPPQERSASSSS